MWPQAEDTRERSESILEGHLSINLDLTPPHYLKPLALLANDKLLLVVRHSPLYNRKRPPEECFPVAVVDGEG